VGNFFLLLRSYNGLRKPNDEERAKEKYGDEEEEEEKNNNHTPKIVAQSCHKQAGCDCMEGTKKKAAI
jgi:hypothetical protein